MIFADEVATYIANAPSLYRHSRDRFLRTHSIARDRLEEFVQRPFRPPFTSFYVSTVVRGLAGSKSDIDLILVSDKDLSENELISTVLFYEDRRVGAKLLRQGDLVESLNLIKRLGEQNFPQRLTYLSATHPSLPIKWVDLERLVNGISFADETPYLKELPFLCDWWSLLSLRDYRRSVLLASLAFVGVNFSACFAYLVTALIGAMESFMAACGRVGSKTKWTLERWKDVRGAVSSPLAREGIDIIDSLANDAWRESPKMKTAPWDVCGSLDRYFTRMFGALEDNVPAFTPAPYSSAYQFLNGATVLSTVKRSAVVADEVAAALNSCSESGIRDLTPDLARSALFLIQRGFLTLAGTRLNQG